MSDDAPILAELRAIRHELNALRAEIRALAGSRRPQATDAELLRAIVGAVGSRAFAAREIIEHAALQERGELRRAVGSSARSVGKRLRAIEGKTLDGWSVLRVGADSAGVIWRIYSPRV